MKWFYVRWAGLVLVAMVIGFLTFRHYESELKVVTPFDLVQNRALHSATPLRVQGMVKSGTLRGEVERGVAEFELIDDSTSIRVRYHGPPPENLRELKTVVMIGTWDATERVFRAHEIALVSNYGFVASAYVLTFVPIGIVLFSMTRKVAVLMQEIKHSKLYEPGVGSHDHDT